VFFDGFFECFILVLIYADFYEFFWHRNCMGMKETEWQSSRATEMRLIFLTRIFGHGFSLIGTNWYGRIYFKNIVGGEDI